MAIVSLGLGEGIPVLDILGLVNVSMRWFGCLTPRRRFLFLYFGSGPAGGYEVLELAGYDGRAHRV